jgi:hypothetical protein
MKIADVLLSVFSSLPFSVSIKVFSVICFQSNLPEIKCQERHRENGNRQSKISSTQNSTLKTQNFLRVFVSWWSKKSLRSQRAPR